jgi:hypothetical protein
MLASTLRQCVSTMAVVCLLTACTRYPQRLVGGLIEGMNEQAASAAIGVPIAKAHVDYAMALPRKDPRPAYSEKTVSFGSVSCGGQVSDMTLDFFRGQLEAVTCFPRDVIAMSRSLRNQYKISADKIDFEFVDGGVAIRGGLIRGRWGVTYTSKKLKKEWDAWVLRYS